MSLPQGFFPKLWSLLSGPAEFPARRSRWGAVALALCLIAAPRFRFQRWTTGIVTRGGGSPGRPRAPAARAGDSSGDAAAWEFAGLDPPEGARPSPVPPAAADGDPRCFLPGRDFAGDDERVATFRENAVEGRGPLESYSIGACRYLWNKRMVPEGGYVRNIDFVHFRRAETNSTHEQRSRCYLRCLDLADQTNEARGFSPDARSARHLADRGGAREFSPDALSAAAWMGVEDAVDALVNERGVDPRDTVSSPAEGGDAPDAPGDPPEALFRPNAYQAAIMGGHAEALRTLVRGDVETVIDEHGRTVRDYLSMAGSPIRPHYAREVLGVSDLKVAPARTAEATIEERGGWNRTSVNDFDEHHCDFDVIDATKDDLTLEAFVRDYYLTGRPVVFRNQVSREEMDSFSKKAWSKLKSFHPKKNQFKVGASAYPHLSQQERCNHTLTIEQIERGEPCASQPELHMMHVEHDEHLEEVFWKNGGDPEAAGASFARVGDWFGSLSMKHGWQVFFGGDMSGATLHWHAAAFNILYVGVKQWLITPPRYRGFSGMPAEKVYERLRDAPFAVKCTQLPGDLIYVPDHWGHMTLNRGFGIGVAAIVGQVGRMLPGLISKRKKAKGAEVSKKQQTGTPSTNKTPGGYAGAKVSKKQQTVEVGNAKIHGDEYKMRAKAPKKQRAVDVEDTKIPFFFVHINKTGGTSMIRMFSQFCPEAYVKGRNDGNWYTEGTEGSVRHRAFHATAHSWIARHGRAAWDDAYTFAVVRHPLARQVSNFFFLVGNCRKTGRCAVERGISALDPDSPDEEKIEAFHRWMAGLYRDHPPGSADGHLVGSKGHGNEVYPTFNATQTSWLVDRRGEKIVVKEVFKLEELSNSMDKLAEGIPCLAGATMGRHNPTAEYPHYTKFANNEHTNEIMREVFGVDYKNFGYDM